MDLRIDINRSYAPYFYDYSHRFEVYYGGAGSGKSHFIAQKILFKANFDRTTEYGMFMTMLVSYVLSGKNKHDDVPDALSMLIEFWESFTGQKVQIMARPF